MNIMVTTATKHAHKKSVIAWDFDGVINQSKIDGKIVWAKDFEKDTNLSLDIFEQYIFGEDFKNVLRGDDTLQSRLDRWASSVGYKGDIAAIVQYWFSRDTNLDQKILRCMHWLQKNRIEQVIATNNEIQRAHYIAVMPQLGPFVANVFCSAQFGALKPEPEFFEGIQEEMKLLPENFVLIDDSDVNVFAAQKLGWQGIFYSAGTDIRFEIESMLGLEG